MAHMLPPTDDMLTRVAELRAEGKSWEIVAQTVNREPRTLRRWRVKYRERWDAIQVRAERHVATEGECESVLVLRSLLRSKDEKLRWHAAKTLLSLRVDLGKLDVRKPPSAPPAPFSPELTRFLQQVQGYSDVELDELAAPLGPLADAAVLEPLADAGGGAA